MAPIAELVLSLADVLARGPAAHQRCANEFSLLIHTYPLDFSPALLDRMQPFFTSFLNPTATPLSKYVPRVASPASRISHETFAGATARPYSMSWRH